MVKKEKRIAIFIDGNNFRHGLKALLKDENIDWNKFLNLIKRNHEIFKVTYYIGKITHPLFDKEKVKEQQKLFKSLKSAGIETWEGYFNDDKHEKGVDVQIALDLVVGAIKKEYNTALLISGDGDLSRAVKIAQEHGTRVILGYLAGTKRSSYRISWILKSITDQQAALNKQVLEAHESWKKTHQSSAKKSSKKKPPSKAKKNTPSKKKTPSSKVIPPLLLFTDGGARGNPGPAGCGAIITDKKGQVIDKASKYIGKATNNQAEYQALLLGLNTIAKAVGKKQIESIKCYLDSKLIVEQVKGNWKVKNKDLQILHQKVLIFLKKHPNTTFHHIPRSKNTLADQLANEAMDKKK